ncbi:MAG TPA: class I SAM-dependent methyltransferase [Bryobacteraceae bacterium]|nr:class I SAM-dependent methyltransferase [Bryobacteraceae bacterium]
MAATSQTNQLTPLAFFETANAFHSTAAMRAAIELDLFTAIDEGAATPAALATRCSASERGMRILCDYLAVEGFLDKAGNTYSLPAESSMFLSRKSSAFVGSMITFLTHEQQLANFRNLTAAVRNGGSTDATEIETDHPMWVEFARSMAPMMFMPSQEIAEILGAGKGEPWKVLDVAAGHGIFGIGVARKNPNAQIVALDWPHVLEVAKENAAKMGVADRHSTIGGDALKVDWGSGYDVVLLTNFLHHFDRAACEAILRKAHAAVKEGGRVAILEFVPNDDRVSPPRAAMFPLVMLANTPAGDAYTLRELTEMAGVAGLGGVTAQLLSNGIETLVVATK